MIAIQIFSLLLLMTWLWNIRSRLVELPEVQPREWTTEKGFFRLFFRLALEFLTFSSPDKAAYYAKALWPKLSNLRYQLVLLGLVSTSLIFPLLFLALLFQFNALVFLLPLMVLIFLTRTFLPKFRITDAWLGFFLALFLVDPTLRLLSLNFSQPDSSGLWLWFTSDSIVQLFLGFVLAFLVTLFLQTFFSWSFGVFLIVALLFVSYQMSAQMAAFLLLGERLAQSGFLFRFLNSIQWKLKNRVLLVQVFSLVLCALGFLILRPVNSPSREERVLLLGGIFLFIHFVFFAAMMIYGHFQTKVLKS